MIAIVCSIRHDNMVEEMNAHDLTSLLHALRQCIVNSAGTCAAAGVVMALYRQISYSEYSHNALLFSEFKIRLRIMITFALVFNY